MGPGMRLLFTLLATALFGAGTSHPAIGRLPVGTPRADSGLWILHGRVVMSHSRGPLPHAEVWVEGTPARAMADSMGQFDLSARTGAGDTLWVRARHLGFFPARGATAASSTLTGSSGRPVFSRA